MEEQAKTPDAPKKKRGRKPKAKSATPPAAETTPPAAEEKPKKKVRMPGFALFCKKMQEHVMDEVIAFVKRKIEHPQSPLVIHLFRELTLQNLKMWNALTHEERGDWRERAKEIEVEVSDDIDN